MVKINSNELGLIIIEIQMAFIALEGCYGVISWFFALMLPEEYTKKQIIVGLIRCILMIIIGGIFSSFKFFQFVSQITIIL